MDKINIEHSYCPLCGADITPDEDDLMFYLTMRRGELMVDMVCPDCGSKLEAVIQSVKITDIKER
jgi:uncharacterized protein (UPF0212 family)